MKESHIYLFWQYTILPSQDNLTLFFLAKTTSGPLISLYAYLCIGVDQ